MEGHSETIAMAFFVFKMLGKKVMLFVLLLVLAPSVFGK
jgi:hypothetical protein